MRAFLLPLLAASSLALGGCVASMAASAVGAAVRAAAPEPRVVTDDLRGTAREACRARVAPLGQVQIIDAEQRTDGRVTVWGTVQDTRERRSFECVYDREVKAFRLRAIRQPPTSG
jgi:hypothetical protein